MGAGGPGCGDGRKPYFPESDLSLEIYVDRARWERPALAASQQVHWAPQRRAEHRQGWAASGWEHAVFLGFGLCELPKHGVLL